MLAIGGVADPGIAHRTGDDDVATLRPCGSSM